MIFFQDFPRRLLSYVRVMKAAFLNSYSDLSITVFYKFYFQ